MYLDFMLIAAAVLLAAFTFIAWRLFRISKVFTQDSTQIEELAKEVESLKKGNDERENLVGYQEDQQEDLNEALLWAKYNRQLYLLMKGLLDGHELLNAARKSAKKPASGKTDNEAPKTKPSAKKEQNPFSGDEEHDKAALIARVMIADLFLYHQDRLENCVRVDILRKRLDSYYQGARKTFESRVPERVFKERHYLDIEFERMLKERIEGLSAPDKETPLADKNPTEDEQDPIADHHDASQFAKVMISDLILDNWNLVEEGIREGGLSELLDEQYQGTRDVFESRVAEQVWSHRHYLDIEFNRVLGDWQKMDSIEIESILVSQKPITRDSLDMAFDRVLLDKNRESDAIDRGGTPAGEKGDEEHKEAALVAKLIVEDLFYHHRDLLEKGLSADILKKCLNRYLLGARQTFESCVPERVWREKHYLNIEFERMLQEHHKMDSFDSEFEQLLRDRVKNLVG